jgi:hypothetical protein
MGAVYHGKNIDFHKAMIKVIVDNTGQITRVKCPKRKYFKG